MDGCECSGSTDISPWEGTLLYTVFCCRTWLKCEEVQGAMHCSLGAGMRLGIFRYATCIQYMIGTCCNTLHRKPWYWVTGKCSLHWRFLKHTDFVFCLRSLLLCPLLRSFVRFPCHRVWLIIFVFVCWGQSHMFDWAALSHFQLFGGPDLFTEK